MHTLCCLLLCFADHSLPDPLPDVPPGLPPKAECERLSWKAWGLVAKWQGTAYYLEGEDNARVREVAHYWACASWAWWYAGQLQDRDLPEDARNKARAFLLSRVSEQDYRAGYIPEPEP